MSEELKFSQKFTSYIPKEQKVLPIQEHDWNKVKEMLMKCSPNKSWSLKDIGLMLIGGGISAFLSLVALYNSGDVADWILNLNWIILVCTLVLGVVLLFLDKDRVENQKTNIQQIIDEMSHIEGKYHAPSKDIIKKSENAGTKFSF